MNLRELLERYYSHRVCFVCDRTGMCEHRELRVAMAEIEWLETYGPNRKPVKMERKRQWQVVRRA